MYFGLLVRKSYGTEVVGGILDIWWLVAATGSYENTPVCPVLNHVLFLG